MLLALVALLGGFVLLVKGADWLVEGATSIAQRLGLSDLMIGLTVVSFGTSAPELIVNIIASFQDNAGIAIGNVVGSNISNTLLILGVTAIITPLAVQRSTIIKEIPFTLLASLTLIIMANDMLVDGYPISELSRSDGLAFLGFFVIFMYYTFGMKNPEVQENGHTKPDMSLWKAWGLFLVGLTGLALGGKLAVDGAISIATIFGMSETLIGLTIVALGTSLPELAASIVAARKGKADIAIGNIVGSNIFNIFWILGLSAFIKPLPFEPIINFDLSVVVASTLLLFLLIHNGHLHRRLFFWWKQEKDYILNRKEGIVLLTGYILYISYIVYRDFTMT
ncbi:calcium/sodium antiporter [Candidatus Peregrinibacteria bacterium]|jgi:cation:H+ antiporter|nr:calcium/sodium antiporter [Candidatus Peregrinibacteria bacterium]MBT5468336.1 calcium/sodium antiporter [Candidatus Peregrinibacteria bacterium]MBT7337864.1 calcium/sodium antiporter [Candidatus Peregrinibacteria bacterium]